MAIGLFMWPFSGKTQQKVKRAAPGGDGYTFDHFQPMP
jgi:hypothetical protein